MFMHRPAQHRQGFFTAAWASLFGLLVLAALGTSPTYASAQAMVPAVPVAVSPAASSARSPAANNPARTASAPKVALKSAWQDLSPSQQVSLKPLAEKWNTLGESHKRKWIAMAANYAKLAPEEQSKLHSRMTEWVSLSQQQRAQARLNFAESKKLTPSQKAATWNAYQALSPEEKQKLARAVPPKPVGAAAAVKPVSPQKLANIPVAKQAAKQVPKMAAAGHALNRNTLLPESKPEPQSSSTH